VGRFPPGWAEWNDRYRDTVRDFWTGSAAAKDIAPRLCASGDVFNQEATMLLVLNAHHDLVEFTLPECAGERAMES
jgi:pullulanase/glycogen debranching enzyme